MISWVGFFFCFILLFWSGIEEENLIVKNSNRKKSGMNQWECEKNVPLQATAEKKLEEIILAAMKITGKNSTNIVFDSQPWNLNLPFILLIQVHARFSHHSMMLQNAGVRLKFRCHINWSCITKEDIVAKNRKTTEKDMNRMTKVSVRSFFNNSTKNLCEFFVHFTAASILLQLLKTTREKP